MRARPPTSAPTWLRLERCRSDSGCRRPRASRPCWTRQVTPVHDVRRAVHDLYLDIRNRLAGTDPCRRARLRPRAGCWPTRRCFRRSAEPQVLADRFASVPDRERPRLAGRPGRRGCRTDRPRPSASRCGAGRAGSRAAHDAGAGCRLRLSSAALRAAGDDRVAHGCSPVSRRPISSSTGAPTSEPRPACSPTAWPPGLSLRLEMVLGDPDRRGRGRSHRLDERSPMRPREPTGSSPSLVVRRGLR